MGADAWTQVVGVDFATENRRAVVARMRPLAILGIVIFPAFSLLDLALVPERFGPYLAIRLVVAALLAVLLWLSTLRRAHSWGYPLAMAAPAVVGLGMAVLIRDLGGYASSYYFGLGLIAFGVAVLYPWPALYTAITCVGLYASWLVPALLLDHIADVERFVTTNSFFVATTLIAVYSSREVHRGARADFARRANLAAANARLADAVARLEEAEQAKSQFFANVSHEIRTPLTLLLAPVESLLSGEGVEPPRTGQRALLRTAHRNAVRLLQLVSGLLDFSRLDAGRLRVRREPVEVVALTGAMLADFEPALRKKGLEAELYAEPREAWVQLDRYLYERILFNLLSNALKFTSAGRVEVAVIVQGEELLLSVTDTGIGIAPDAADTLFERFRQIEGSATRRFEGTGLGLALVREFADLLGGTVDLRSAPGAGSTFTVRLSAPPAEAQPGSPLAGRVRPLVEMPLDPVRADPAPADEGRLEVLVAEDNEELARYVGSVLKDRYRVRWARDGREALEAARERAPDVVLSDVMMPEMDGLSLCRVLKADAALARVPVVLLTALTHREALLEGWEAGADDYLFKPFHPRELVARMEGLSAAVRERRRAEGELLQVNQDLEHRVRERTAELQRSNAALATEVADRVAAQVELEKRARELARSNADLEQFAYAAAHDLAEPMRVVALYVRLIERSLGDDLDPDTRQYIQFAIDGAQRMRELLEGLRRYAQAGRPDLVEVVDADDALAAALDNLSALIETQGGTVTFDPLPPVRGDRVQLIRVFQNLVANALKFRGERPPHVRVTARPEERMVHFEVQDDGIGIDAAHLERIFEFGRRLHTRSDYPGSGIGLAVVRRIVEQHGGRMWVQSTPGVGSVFHFTLPAAQAVPKTPQGSAAR